ncbi:hypothetical protein BASA81_001539 [Batrachochytrium salamandrivorans]|nr:hypothetical protein BASA81_001539 [Batrachochytrium salamandrivorans]
MDYDEEQATSFLTQESRTSLAQGKSRLAETIELGGEILKSLQSDRETIRRLNSSTRQMERETLRDSSDTLGRMERKKLLELACVCLALTSVLCGMFLVLVYRLILRTSEFGS